MTTHIRLFYLLLFFCNVLTAQKVVEAVEITNNNSAKTVFEQLQREEVLELTITTDLTSLIQNRRTEDYTEATLSYENTQGKEVLRSIKVQPRGKFRRRVCDFPPVRLKFAKKDLQAEGLASKFNEIKLVTHCLDDKDAGNENLLKEYLLYQLYNEITPHSYRAQLVKVTYVDAKGQQSKVKRYGILLEDTDEMAARLGGKELDQLNIHPDSLSAKDETTMAVFEYMIANLDWDIKMVRNAKLVLRPGSAEAIPVPYDFDFSGFVNASYALVKGEMGQRLLRDRIYIGNAFDSNTMRNTLAHFIEKKSAVLKRIKNFKSLDVATRSDLIQYIESFYNAIEPAQADTKLDLVAFFKLKNATVESYKQVQFATDIR